MPGGHWASSYCSVTAQLMTSVLKCFNENSEAEKVLSVTGSSTERRCKKTGEAKAQTWGHAEENKLIAAFGSHAFAEAGQRAGLLLVAPLSEPALDGPHVPVQLLGQALQPLLIRMLGGKGERALAIDCSGERNVALQQT